MRRWYACHCALKNNTKRKNSEASRIVFTLHVQAYRLTHCPVSTTELRQTSACSQYSYDTRPHAARGAQVLYFGRDAVYVSSHAVYVKTVSCFSRVMGPAASKYRNVWLAIRSTRLPTLLAMRVRASPAITRQGTAHLGRGVRRVPSGEVAVRAQSRDPGETRMGRVQYSADPAPASKRLFFYEFQK